VRVACNGSFQRKGEKASEASEANARHELLPPPRVMRSAMRMWLQSWVGYRCDSCRARKHRTRCHHMPSEAYVAKPAMAAARHQYVVGEPLSQCIAPECSRPRR